MSAEARPATPPSRKELLLFAPMRLEARALRRGAPHARIEIAGIGPRRARRAAPELAELAASADAVAVAGFGGALDAELQPGEVVVASELRDGERTVAACPGAGIIAGLLRRRGLSVRVGPIASVRAPATGVARAELARTGALAVDMESAWLAGAAGGRPFGVVRAILDTGARELWNPKATVAGLVRASRSLRLAAAALAEWASVVEEREIVLAAPRASCAGVERAIEVVERVLDRYGPPVYLRKQIVHNRHVVDDLERRGAVCVDELDEVPDGATVVFSAHGVSPSVRRDAQRRNLNVVDATCPLVSKVHAEARRFAGEGYTIVLVGHEGHEEVEGTTGEVGDQIRVIADVDEVDEVEIPDPSRVAYLTQTTLAVDETRTVVDALRDRFPDIVGPRSDDICYATQNRQDAVRALTSSCDLVLVVGSRNSSNSNRLVEVVERRGCPARLVDDETEVDPAWFANARRVGVTAGASSPERIVQRVVSALGVLGPLTVVEEAVTDETVRFALPPQVKDHE